MTTEDLLQAAKFLRDLRFIQASAAVNFQIHEDKKTIAYMRNLHRIEQLIERVAKEQTNERVS